MERLDFTSHYITITKKPGYEPYQPGASFEIRLSANGNIVFNDEWSKGSHYVAYKILTPIYFERCIQALDDALQFDALPENKDRPYEEVTCMPSYQLKAVYNGQSFCYEGSLGNQSAFNDLYQKILKKLQVNKWLRKSRLDFEVSIAEGSLLV